MALNLKAIRQKAQDGLLALCVEVGFKTLKMMLEQELEEKAGKKGKPSLTRWKNGNLVLRWMLAGLREAGGG